MIVAATSGDFGNDWINSDDEPTMEVEVDEGIFKDKEPLKD